MLINGKERICRGPVVLAEILTECGFDLNRVAVMVDGDIVPKDRLAETLVDADASVEVVSFVGGG